MDKEIISYHLGESEKLYLAEMCRIKQATGCVCFLFVSVFQSPVLFDTFQPKKEKVPAKEGFKI